MSDDIQARVQNMIVDRLFLKIDPEELESDASLIDVYGVDSVSLLELVVGLEEEFGIELDDDDFNVAHFETVDAIEAFILERC